MLQEARGKPICSSSRNTCMPRPTAGRGALGKHDHRGTDYGETLHKKGIHYPGNTESIRVLTQPVCHGRNRHHPPVLPSSFPASLNLLCASVANTPNEVVTRLSACFRALP